MPHELGLPEHTGASSPPPPEAKTESFFVSFVEPQLGHLVPFQSFDRTRISFSFPHFPHSNS
jgi:hypothetical protein